MRHPKKWRDTINPYDLQYKNFRLTEILGYPHAGNDVFHAKGICENEEVDVFIKSARQNGADIKNEIKTINALKLDIVPKIIDYDETMEQFVVSLSLPGERLSAIVGDNASKMSMEYMYEYGQTLAKLHDIKGEFSEVKDRRFFHIPEKEYFEEDGFGFVYDYLMKNKPPIINKCFCHGDFHYANILWENRHMSAILDFELAGLGNKEFDIAWALILRPGQRFLNTKEEVDLFLQGYSSVGTFEYKYVKYYMVQIYVYFYRIGRDDKAYQKYIMKVFEENCKED